MGQLRIARCQSNHGKERVEDFEFYWVQRKIVCKTCLVRSIAVCVINVVDLSTSIPVHISCLAPYQTTVHATINYGKAKTINNHP